MAVVEVERSGSITLIRMNRPERLNALGGELRAALGEAWRNFRDDPDQQVAIFTGTGKGFCAGEDMKESIERGAPGFSGRIEDPYSAGTLDKPVIAAINGYAMGAGFQLVERADLRVAAAGAVFEVSEAKRWLLGGFQHGFGENLPWAIVKEMALGFRFSAQRLYEVGFLNRLVEDDELLPTAYEMAEHLLSLPPASLVNTLHITRLLRPRVPANFEDLAERLRSHGAQEDLMESRRAFAEKRTPDWKGWDDPADRHNLPQLEPAEGEGR